MLFGYVPGHRHFGHKAVVERDQGLVRTRAGLLWLPLYLLRVYERVFGCCVWACEYVLRVLVSM